MPDDTATQTQTGTTTTATTNWVDTLPDPVKGFALNKGWDKPEKSVQSYIELEKMIGADKAGRTVVLPGDKATPEEVAAFRSKLGVPAEAKDYEITLPDGFPDPEFGNLASGLLLKHGVPKSAAQGLMTDFMAQVQAGETARLAEETKRFSGEMAELKTEMGADFDKKMELGKRAFAKAGMPTEVMDLIEDALHDKGKPGTAAMLKFAANLGEMLGEGRFVDADGGGSGFGETLAHLNAKRLALYSDPAWAARFHANDAGARTEAKALEDKIAALRPKSAA